MSEIKRIGLRMPMGLYMKLEGISKRYGIAVANLINFVVAQWVDNQLYVRDKLIDTFKDEIIQQIEEVKIDECT